MASGKRTPRNLHDRAFKALFAPPAAALSLLRASLPAALLDGVDPGSLVCEPTTFVDSELGEDERDLVFSARLRGKPAIFYLLEHQRTTDRFMPLRLLRYVLKVWDWWRSLHPEAKSLPAVIPVVLHQGARPWAGPRALSELIALEPDLLLAAGPHLPALQIALQDLGASSCDDLANFPGPPVVRIALTLMRAVADPEADPLAALARLEQALRELFAQEGGSARLSLVLRYTVLARPDLDPNDVADALRRVAGPEPAEVVMPSVQQMMEQDRRRLIEAQLRAKFGRVSDEALRRLRAASLDELERWAIELITAARVEDLFAPGPAGADDRGPDAE